MLALLVLLGGVQHVRPAVTDLPKETNYVIRQNASCHALGLFFQREAPPGSSVGSELCSLCFCKSNDTAVCWRRENRRCDFNLRDELGNRTLRARRSMKSYSDVFVRDAARDFFNKQSPEQCKPFESSFSDGCPPADWCTGCTVCECDANGRWDCHILSFCDDRNGTKQIKKRRGHPKNHISKRHSKTSTTTLRPKITTKKALKKAAGKRSVSPKMRRNQVIQSSAINKHKIDEVKSKKINKFAPVKKPLPKLQAKKGIPSRNKVTGRPLYINKNLSTKKPIDIKSRNENTVKNNTVEVAQHIVKQFMSTMQKMIKQIDLKTNNTTKQGNNAPKKRSMSKINKNKKDLEKAESKFVPKSISYVNKKNLGNRNRPKSEITTTSTRNGRIKRQLTTDNDAYYESDSNYSYKRNAITDRTNYSVVNNSTSATFNMPYNFNNNFVNIVQQKSTTNREINNHVNLDNKKNIVKAEFHNGVNIPTFSWTVNNSGFQYNNLSDKAENAPALNKGHVRQILKKEVLSPVETHKVHSCKLRTLLQKLIDTDIHLYNNSIENSLSSLKPKRNSILKKIKRLVRKSFNKKNRDMLRNSDDLYYSDYDRKQFDYKTSGNCKIDTKEKNKLRQSINALKRESELILRTIGIIKGLLHILEINNNKTQYKPSNEIFGINDNIDKLNIIVKNIYSEGENGKKLTQDQRTQISYIKDNVNVFIKSIGTFARILEDVIQSAVCLKKRENKVNYANISTYSVINNITKDNGNSTQTQLDKLKKILFKYNILQNKFIHQIYVILNNLDAKASNEYILTPQNILHNEHGTKMNKTDAIETNSANIIQNLRKLKLLAEIINDQRRPKREAIDDDDALQYLLILMEYLLKRHGPTYSSANDGLDLLIEAIKRAPDIKVIRKKVLNSQTDRRLVTRTTTPIRTLMKYTDYSSSDTIRKQIKKISEIDKYKTKLSNESEDGVDDHDEFKEEKDSKHFSSEQHRDDMSLGHNNISITNESYYNAQDKSTIRKSPDTGNRNLLYKLIRDDSSEEETTTTFSNIMPFQSDISSLSPVTDYSSFDNLLVDNKSNIDWIEENFKNIKQSREKVMANSTPKSFTATRTQKYLRNKSNVTEESITISWKKVDNVNEKEQMSKKQMDLLNSLDYVEDEMDSKDDKFSSDTYVLNE